MKRYSLILLALSCCAPNPSAQTEELMALEVQQRCGGNTEDALPNNVLIVNKCEQGVANKYYGSAAPYPDLYQELLAKRELAAEKYQANKYSHAEFKAELASQIVVYTSKVKERQYQEASSQPVYIQQPISLPQLQPITNPNRIHCTTSRLGIYGQIDCY